MDRSIVDLFQFPTPEKSGQSLKSKSLNMCLRNVHGPIGEGGASRTLLFSSGWVGENIKYH
jgi:hypothetical protein